MTYLIQRRMTSGTVNGKWVTIWETQDCADAMSYLQTLAVNQRDAEEYHMIIRYQ